MSTKASLTVFLPARNLSRQGQGAPIFPHEGDGVVLPERRYKVNSSSGYGLVPMSFCSRFGREHCKA